MKRRSTEHPILFSGDMARAILAGKKTATRRTIRGQTPAASCPFGVQGDRLWVRETWRAEERSSDRVAGVRFAADEAFVPIQNTRAAADLWIDAYDNGRHGTGWRPSIFMPRWASRITLVVTMLRTQRLQDITEADADAEGVEVLDGVLDEAALYRRANQLRGCATDARTWFAELWDSLNGKRPGCAWKDNPWVWAVDFERENR